MLNGCSAASITIHSFRIFNIPQHCCLDMSLVCPVTPVTASCAKSILNLIVPSASRSDHWLQWCWHKYLRFSEFEILRQRYLSPLMCSNYSQPGLENDVLDLFNVLNLIVLSLSRSGQWFWCCRHKYLNFRNLRSCNSCIHHLWSAPTTVSQAFGIPYWTYLVRWNSSCHPPCDLVNGCSAASTISPIFGIWDPVTATFTTFDVLQLQSGTPLEWCPRPIQYAGSPRDIHFLIRSLAVALEAQTLPIFAFLKSGRPRRCVNMVMRVYINFCYMVGAQPTRTANQDGQPGPPARMASS